MLKRIVAMAGVMVIAFAVPATAKPVSTYHAEFTFGNATDVLRVEFNDLSVTSVSLSMSCGPQQGVLSYQSTSVSGSLVTIGRKADGFFVDAQFTASITECDGSQVTEPRYLRLSNFATTGKAARDRDRSTGSRTLAVPVEVDLVFVPLPSQPLQGTLTEVITKG